MVIIKRLVLLLLFVTGILICSCSKRKPSPTEPFSSGLGYCNGSLGQFDVNLVRSKAYPSFYRIKVSTVDTTYPQHGVRVALTSPDNQVKELNSVTPLVRQKTLVSAYLSQYELETYRYLVVVKYDGTNSNFLDIREETDAICELPTVDNTTGQTALP